MKIIDAKDAILGRLGTYVVKEALKGEEIAIINCEEILVSGKKENLKEDIRQKRSRVGSSQKGPIYSRDNVKFVKRSIRGMFPNHRQGRGREAYKKVKCYKGVPKEFENKEKITLGVQKRPTKYLRVKELLK